MISLGHVNIRTSDLEASVRFYRDVIGLRPGPAATRPGSPDHVWMHDTAGNPCIHLQLAAASPETEHVGAGVHHVALNCANPDHWRQKLGVIALPFRETTFETANLLQLNIEDPDGVRLELLFELQ